MKQKKIFLKSEGDAWFFRNQQKIGGHKLSDSDFLLRELIEIFPRNGSEPVRILEVGCGGGERLAWISDNLNADCYGIEPSINAVSEAVAKGVKVQQGTADKLPFEQGFFNIVIFGFCLYLCDREDLFLIASEADRVLRSSGWLVIMDFFNQRTYENDYQHYPGLKSFKMDYRNLFIWHPSYECMTHKIRHHSDCKHTDVQDEWVALSILRKYQKS